MKYLSLFSGIGAFEKALARLKIPYELVGFSEIDEHAIKSYCAIHGVDEAKNFGDITKIDEKQLPKDIDLITYGFPCQDISIAGKKKGLFNEDGSQTRSGLFFEALRIINETKPVVAIAENVKNLIGKQFQKQFQIVLDSLSEIGYNNYWKVLNSKDYGIPQNRERVFIVSIRKDVDNGKFQFPEEIPIKLLLKYFMEKDVEEKYFMSQEKYKTLVETAKKNGTDNEKELMQIGYINNHNGDANRVYNNTIARTLKVEEGGSGAKTGWYKVDFVVCEERCDEGIRFFKDDVCGTLRTIESCGNKRVIEIEKDNDSNISSRIRKLTPKEAFRLMGFDDVDFSKVANINSNTQLYKQAGNCIVVQVAEQFLKQLFQANVFQKQEQKIVKKTLLFLQKVFGNKKCRKS